MWGVTDLWPVWKAFLKSFQLSSGIIDSASPEIVFAVKQISNSFEFEVGDETWKVGEIFYWKDVERVKLSTDVGRRWGEGVESALRPPDRWRSKCDLRLINASFHQRCGLLISSRYATEYGCQNVYCWFRNGFRLHTIGTHCRTSRWKRIKRWKRYEKWKRIARLKRK